MEELMAHESDDACRKILSYFSFAHSSGFTATGSRDHARSFAGLQQRQIPLLGQLQRFRDQGEAMCSLSNILRILKRNSEATTWYQRARDVGAAHGFFTLESSACTGLGEAAMEEGRDDEGLALLRNALVAAELNELDNPMYELKALQSLMHALFEKKMIEEVEPLALRYRELAKAKSEKETVGASMILEFQSLLVFARLHEVLCLCTLRWEPHTTAQLLRPVRP